MIESKDLIQKASEILKSGSENNWFDQYIDQNHNRFVSDLDHISRFLTSNKMKIGDLGAAPFVIDLALTKLGHDVTCFDVAPERFSHLEKFGLNLEKVDLDKWTEVNDSSYELVLFTEVFEHLRGDLLRTCQNIYDMLKPGGILYLTTPNIRSVLGFYKLIFKKVSYSISNDLYHEWRKLETLGHMGHVREYTLHEVSTLFKSVGFEAVQIQTKPVKVGPGLINKIFYHMEYLLNSLTLGSSSNLILRKPL